MPPSEDETTRLLEAAGAGDRPSAEKLLELVYDELRRMAEALFRHERPDHTLQPTALVHEAYVRLIGPGGRTWQNRAHFFAVAAKAMRHTLVNHALARKAAKRGGDAQTLVLEPDLTPAPQRGVDTLALDDALKTLAELDPRKAQVVEMRFFAGMTVEETAEALNVSVSTIEADWRMAKAWLSSKLAEN